MALLSYMQRRTSGTYEFRKRLPEALAGKPAPAHMRDAFSELINTNTGRFKRELVRSLGTKDAREAKRRDHREALRAAQLFEDAAAALAMGESPRSVNAVDLEEIAADVLVELLAADEGEREDGDDRRRFQTAEDRARWPDLEPVVPTSPDAAVSIVPGGSAHAGPDASIKGMTKDHFLAYGDLLQEFEAEYREAFARRDPTIVRAETQTELKRRGVRCDPASPEFRAVGMAVLQAHVRAYDAMRRRQAGDAVATPRAASGQRGPTLSEAFASWKAGGAARGAKKPVARTIAEAEQVVRYFRELHHHRRLRPIRAPLRMAEGDTRH